MRQSICIAVLIAIILAWLAWPNVYDRHFDDPLPPTAQLDKYKAVSAGFDTSYLFRFSFSDDRFRDQIIRNWNLQLRDDPSYELTSFGTSKPIEWWPVNKLQQMNERYDSVLEEERYWSVWVDRRNNYLYAEYGRW